MPAIRRVEDIDAWQEARALATEVYRLSSSGAWARDFGLRDQVRRAAVSVACNIAEGFARETSVEFNRFLAIARGSATEVKTQMYIALDLAYIDQATFDQIYAQADKICRMITGFMLYLKSLARSQLTAGRNRQLTTDNRQPKPRSPRFESCTTTC